MFNKRGASVAVLSLAISAAVSGFAEDATIDATSTLPDAKPGECYAKVIVPAQFEARASEIEISPEREELKVVSATFDTEDKELEVKPEFTKLVVSPTKYRKEQEQIEVEPARTEWYTSLRRNGIPASPALIVAAKTSGVDIDDAEANSCYREYYQPAKFELEEKQVLVKEGTENFKITEAVFEDAEEEVEVKQSHVVKNLVNAVFDTAEEKIEIEPAKAVWKKGTGLVERIDNTTGEIMCLVQVPAKFETIKKQILKSAAKIEDDEIAAQTKSFKVRKLVSDASHEKVTVEPEYITVSVRKKVEEPKFTWIAVGEKGAGAYTGQQVCLKSIEAKTKTVMKQVVDAEASIEEVKVPAETQVIKVQKVATASEVERTTVPAQTKQVEKRVRVAKEKLEWRRVLCRTNMTSDLNKSIQSALKEAGYYNGPVDGSIGRGTMSAVEKYQRDNDLPRGGLTIKVLEELDIM